MAAATRSAGSTPDLAIVVQTHQFDGTALPWLKAHSSALPEIQAHPLSLPVREKQGVVHFEEMASRPDQHWALAPMLHRQLDGGPRRRASAATHAASLVVALAGAGPASTGAAMDVRLAPIPAPPDNPPPRPARGRGGTRRRCGTGCGRVYDARVHPSRWRRAAARGTDPASKRRNKCRRQPGCSSALPELRENTPGVRPGALQGREKAASRAMVRRDSGLAIEGGGLAESGTESTRSTKASRMT